MKTLNKKLRRDLLSNRWLFLAVTVVVTIGVALFVASLTAFMNLNESYEYSYRQLNFADFTLQVTSAPTEASAAAAAATAAAAELRSIPGVAVVEARANIDIGLNPDPSEQHSLIVRAISLPSDRRPAVNDLKIETGAYFQPDDTHQVLLEKSFADFHQLQPGDILTLTGNGAALDFRVAGIVASPEYIFPAKSRSEFFVSPEYWGVVFIPDTALPELTGAQFVNEFCVLLDPNSNAEVVLAQCRDSLSPLGILDVVTRDEQPSNAGLKMDLQEFGEIADIFPVLFLFVGAMTTYILITRIIQRQRTQLGLMRALGYSRRRMLLHYLSLSLIIGVSGALAGVVAGYFLANTITRVYVGMLGLPYMVTATQWTPLAEGLFIGILPSLIAGIFPALSAARLRPAEAMRTPPPITGRKLLLEKALPALAGLPLVWKMPLRNIFRNRRRSLSTILGVVFGSVLILASLGFIDSMDSLFKVQFDRIQKYDARLTFAQPQPESELGQIGAWQGVTTVDPLLEIPASLEYDGRSFSTLVDGLPAGTDLYGLYTPNGTPTTVVSGRILLAEAIRDKLRIETGRTIHISSPLGERDLEVAGFIRQPMGAYGFVTLEDARTLLGNQPVVTGVMLKVEDGFIPAVREAAAADFSASSLEISADVRSRMLGLMRFVYAMMGVMLAFGAVLTLMVVFTMITISLIERRREIATMRTLGEVNRRINAMVSIENLILGLAGLVIGIPLGYAVTDYLMRLFQTDMFSFNLVFYPRSFLLTAAIILLIMLVSEVPGLRNLAGLDLARVTKEQVS